MAAKRSKSKILGDKPEKLTQDDIQQTPRTSLADQILMQAEALAAKKQQRSDAALAFAHLSANLSPLTNDPGLFKDEADYERVTNSVVARIRSGEVKPSAPDEDE